MYADDLVIVSATEEGLQEKLGKLSQFAEVKDLTINTKKSQVMIFNKTGKLLKGNFSIYDQKLDIVPKYTYLGVDIPASGTFSTSIRELTSKAKKAMMPLYTTIMQFNIPFDRAMTLFRTYIEPILLYNAENQSAMTDSDISKCLRDRSNIYQVQQASPLTTTQLKFTKFILGVGKYCPNMSIFGESAKIPFLARAHIHMLKFWHRIRDMDEITLVNMAYRENVSMNSNWCRTIQVLNATYNLHATHIDPTEFPDKVKKVIFHDFTEYWKTRITNPAIEKKLGLYATVKSDFNVSEYTRLPFRDRQIIAKFLCASHKLQVETGRHLDIPRENRICKLCTLNKVEDEEHFILECPAYSKIRNDAFQGKDVELRHTLAHQPEALASFLRKAYTLRDEIMEEQPTDVYHVAHKKIDKSNLLLRLQKGPKVRRIHNVTKDGLKMTISLKP
jgi:hypothetical protein